MITTHLYVASYITYVTHLYDEYSVLTVICDHLKFARFGHKKKKILTKIKKRCPAVDLRIANCPFIN